MQAICGCNYIFNRMFSTQAISHLDFRQTKGIVSGWQTHFKGYRAV